MTALIKPLAWESPYAAGEAVEKTKKKKKRNNKDQRRKLREGGLCFVLFSSLFLGLHSWHMKVTRLEVELELQLQAYTTATAT